MSTDKLTDCFLPYSNSLQIKDTINELSQMAVVNKIYLLATGDNCSQISNCEVVLIDSLRSSATVKKIARLAQAPFTMIYLKDSALSLGLYALERMTRIAADNSAAMVYADHYQIISGEKKASPVITYQFGSLRDDFNFGSVLLFNTNMLKEVASEMDEKYKYAGLYDLRLRASRRGELLHINEYLYTEIEHDNRKSGEKIFDYVDPKNRAVQIEMEEACTEYLKALGGYLKPDFTEIDFNKGEFRYEASVIIPVFNRIKTIKDAIASVLRQKTSFPFNLIIVDNHSTDGTYEAIEEFSSDKRLIHIVPQRSDLGIGGCWNMGVNHPECGKFAVQLDSDDIYPGEETLQKVVDTFYREKCAMVVGTYMMTNFEMEMIPPGVIDHREWTLENGRNNALRINGLGAPRAFYTPILREVKLPNTSYGEDYALGLNISREYRIGRIYDVIYHCRRWEGNSDAALDVVKMNAHNTYKDRIRSWELKARILLNKKNG